MASKIIKSFDLDLSDIPAAGESRAFSIIGDLNAEFRLEIRRNSSDYYNFITNTFSSTKAVLESTVQDFGGYNDTITFPAVVGSDDTYDIYLFATGDTEHNEYNEVRFGDGSIDINSTSGSNSLLLKKVVYQYATQLITITTISQDSTIETGSRVNDTVTVSRGSAADNQSFEIKCSVTTSTKSYQILKQPLHTDFLALNSFVVGDPLPIDQENIYPTARAVFTGDDVDGAVTSGPVVRMSNTDLSEVIEVGDKITASTTTDVLDNHVGGSSKIYLTVGEYSNRMSVGDQITSTAGNLKIDSGVYLVKAVNLGGDATHFEIGDEAGSVAPSDIVEELNGGVSVIFSPKVNRSLTTVTVVESGAATDFRMSQDIQFIHGATLTFTPEKHYRWEVNNINNIVEGMFILPGNTVMVANSTVSEYLQTVTLFENTDQEQVLIKKQIPALSTLGKKPTITNGLVTTQPGAVVFNNAQPKALNTTTIKIGGYGEQQIQRVSGYELKLTNLQLTLNTVTTTTTSAVNNSTSVPVAERNGIINTVSSVSGIGINPNLADPTVSSGGGATGAGTVVLSAAQTLENGASLTFANGGQTATITGDIEVIKAGPSALTLYLDVKNLLSIT